MPEYPEIAEGAVDDIVFNRDGTLKRFVRLPYMDIADNHKWAEPFIVQAYTEGRFDIPLLMVVWDLHPREDFSIARKIPPQLPEKGDREGAKNHFQYAARHLNQVSHLAPLAFLGMVDEMIVVYHREGMTYENLENVGVGESVRKGRYKSGRIDSKAISLLNAYKSSGVPEITEGVFLSDGVAFGDAERQIEVFFTELEDYPALLQERMQARGKGHAVHNIDFDYFFPPRESSREALVQRFRGRYNEGRRMAEPSYIVGCTSTDDPSNMPGIGHDELREAVREVYGIISPGSPRF